MKIAAVDLREHPDRTTEPSRDLPDSASWLSDALSGQHDVTLYCRHQDTGGPAVAEGGQGSARTHRLRIGPPEPLDEQSLLKLMPELGGGLAALWAAERPDVIHTHGWLAGMAALAASRDSGIPVVASFDSLAVVDCRHRVQDSELVTRTRLERAIAQGVSHVVATSSAQALELVRMGVDRRKVSVVPQGVDLDLFQPEGPVAQRTDRPRVLHLGRLETAGGVDDVVLALRKTPGVELVVAGGPDRDRVADHPDARRIIDLARSSGVEDRVELVGHVLYPEVPALLRSAEMLVTVPRDEPFGRSALEAMACGTPVVASGVGGLADSVIDGTTGLLVPPRDPDALAYALRRILRDPVRREGFGVAGVDRAQVRYSWARVAQDVAAVYARLARPEEERAGVSAQVTEDDPVEVEV